MFNTSRRLSGFTLVEVIVVIATLAFILPIITIILFMVLRQQLAITRMTEAKRQGDLSATLIQNTLERDVEKIYDISNNEICTGAVVTATNVSYFTDSNANKISFVVTNGVLIKRIINTAGVTTDSPMTNVQKVTIEPSLSIKCIRSRLFTKPLVQVSFSIIPSGNIIADEQNAAKLYYSTKTIIQNMQIVSEM